MSDALFLFKGLAQRAAKQQECKLAQVYEEMSARIGLTNWHVCRVHLQRLAALSANQLVKYHSADNDEKRFELLKAMVNRG